MDSAGKPMAAPCVTVVLYLDSYAKFRHVHFKAVKDAFKPMNAICFKSNYQMVKVGETSIEGCRTERMFCKVRPLSGGFGSIKWARAADVKASYMSHRARVERILSIQFAIIADGNFNDETFCLRNCHTKRPCECKQNGKRTSEPMSKPANKKQEPRSAVGILVHASDDLCKHFASGLCVQTVEGGRCFFKHPAAPLASEVDCKLPRSKKRQAHLPQRSETPLPPQFRNGCGRRHPVSIGIQRPVRARSHRVGHARATWKSRVRFDSRLPR